MLARTCVRQAVTLADESALARPAGFAEAMAERKIAAAIDFEAPVSPFVCHPVPVARPRVLHVSGDFPDSIDPFKTPVVRMLLDLTGHRFHHEVVSLNRRSPSLIGFGRGLITRGMPDLSIGVERFDYGEAIVYEAPPRGLFHATMLRRLGDWLAKNTAARIVPDLIVGHKLAIEGIAVRRAANQLGVPFAICIQGDTDTKVIGARPDLTAEFAKVFHEASVVFPFTPWALRQIEKRLGRRTGLTITLPCPTDLDAATRPQLNGDGFVSVFHLKNHRRKNLQRTVAALRLVREDSPSVGLAIIGGGSETEREQCRSIVAGTDGISFEGRLDREALGERLNRATGLVLPSLRESFGLVFIEALFAGIPVIYPKNAAIDGYFDNASFALGVDAGDSGAIAGAMARLVREEVRLKADLLQWQNSPESLRFKRSEIATSYARGLLQATMIQAGAQSC